MTRAEWQAAMAEIAARLGHGHDGLVPGCMGCEVEQAEVRQFIALHHREERAAVATRRELVWRGLVEQVDAP